MADENPNTFIGRLYSSMKAVEGAEVPEGTEKDEAQSLRYIHMRDHFFDNIDFSEDGLVRSPIYHAKLKDYFDNYIPPLVDTTLMLSDRLVGMIEAGGSKELYKYTVHYLLGFYEKAEYMCFDKGLHHMAKNYYCAGKAFWSDSAFIAKMCEESAKREPTLCEKIAPDLNMPDTAFNRRIRMSEITTPVTVLVFWDINCGHCKKEMPIINRFYDSANKEHVEVYAVYTQGDWEGWKKRIRKDDFKFINVANAFGEDKFRKKYNIVSTPQVYILDKDKTIKFKKVGAKDISGLVDFLLEDQGIVEPPTSSKDDAPKKRKAKG
jgi:thiol-disulfide isomerase/thioredoxin